MLDQVAASQRTLGGDEFDLARLVALARGYGCAVLFGEETITSGHDLASKEGRAPAKADGRHAAI